MGIFLSVSLHDLREITSSLATIDVECIGQQTQENSLLMNSRVNFWEKNIPLPKKLQRKYFSSAFR